MTKFVKHPDFPAILFLLGCALAGALTFRDYGITWDEPLFYAYADAVPYAYSIPARLQGDFDIERAYGPSIYDHKMYGPPYILLARPVVIGLGLLTQATQSERWHLVNFLFFLVGAWLFYRLGRRWLSPGASLAATAFFVSQPLLWGHAFINPKDIPCMVLFIGAMYTGLNLVDATILANSGATLPDADRLRRSWPRVRKIVQIAGGAGLILLVLLLFFAIPIRSALFQAVRALYYAEPGSLFGVLFARLAPNAGAIPVENYLHKTSILYEQARTGLIVLAAPLALAGALVTLLPGLVLRALLQWEASALGPVPRFSWVWLRSQKAKVRGMALQALGAGIFLGAAASIRIIAPLVGFLAVASFLLRVERRHAGGIVLYGLFAALSLIAVWPFLWDAPVARFLETAKYMSNVTNTKPVLFAGQVYLSNALPRSYLPALLGITLTEPAWALFAVGLAYSFVKMKRGQIDWRTFLPLQAWFFIPLVYLLTRQPPMYDGYRHFFFILPPVFITIGVAFQALHDRLALSGLRSALVAASLLPGVVGLFYNHPYQYAYYNAFVGGTGGAFRTYETDFWLTCYKELMQFVNPYMQPGAILYVHRQPPVAREYAAPHIQVEQYEPETAVQSTQNLLLLTTRHNSDLQFDLPTPVLSQVEKHGAVFCLVKSLK